MERLLSVRMDAICPQGKFLSELSFPPLSSAVALVFETTRSQMKMDIPNCLLTLCLIHLSPSSCPSTGWVLEVSSFKDDHDDTSSRSSTLRLSPSSTSWNELLSRTLYYYWKWSIIELRKAATKTYYTCAFRRLMMVSSGTASCLEELPGVINY